MRWAHRKEVPNPYEWHVWFAWFPVKAYSCWVWLEKVERRKVALWDQWCWNYRVITGEQEC